MKTIPTVEGKMYCVSATTECTITSQSGTVLGTASPGTPFWFQAQKGETTTLSDDAAEYSASRFNSAPQQQLALLGVLGGGTSGLPAGYKHVEYLESAGGQIIDTNVSCPIDENFKIDYQFVDGNYVFGCVNLPNLTWGLRDNFCWAGEKGFNISIPDNIKMARNEITLKNQDFDFLLYSEQIRIWSVGDNTQKAASTTVHLFGALFSNGDYRFSKCRIFGFSTTNDTLGRKTNMVPCLDPTGAPCMYDLVRRRPFYNSGTGDFLYPTESTTYSLRRVLPDWGKLTENGLRRLYHAPANYSGELYDYAIEKGYKPIIEPEKPTEGYWAPRWTETENEIILEWVETEPPTDKFSLPAEDLTVTE